MKKVVLVVVGTVLVLVGVVDWLVGALVSHSWWLIVTGLAALAIAGILELWPDTRWWRSLVPAVVLAMATDARAASPIEQALTPPDVTPLVANPAALTGGRFCLMVFIGVCIGLLYSRALRRLGRRPCQPWRRL
jgi:hypothetical protein